MELAINAREALQGKINEAQAANDLTITEKIDDELMQNNEMRKVFSEAMEPKSIKTSNQDWISGLR